MKRNLFIHENTFKYTRFIRYILLCFLFFTSSPGSMISAEEVDIFNAADSAFLERENRDRAFEAIELYGGIYKRFPNDYRAAWRLSMACYFVGYNFIDDESKKKKIFAEGRDAGLAAIEKDPGSVEAHFWTAVNMALYGQTVGVFKMLFTLNTVKDHLRKSIELDPSYAYGGAYRILGKIDESLPGILGGSNNSARDNYKRAIETAPGEPLNYLFLSKLLMKKYDDKQTALETAHNGHKIKVNELYRFESLHALKELEEFINKYAKYVK